MCSLCSWPRTYAQLAVWPLSRPIPQETNRALKGGRKRVGIAARLVRKSKRTSIIGIGPTGGGCQPCIVEVHARSIGPRASSCVDKAPLDSAPFGRFDGRSARACAAIVSCAACRAIAGSKAGAVIASNDVTASGSTHGGSVVPELEAAGRPRIDAGALGVSTCRSMGCGEHEEEERVARHAFHPPWRCVCLASAALDPAVYQVGAEAHAALIKPSCSIEHYFKKKLVSAAIKIMHI